MLAEVFHERDARVHVDGASCQKASNLARKSSSGKIKVYTSKSMTPINKALIEEAATELFGKDQAEKLIGHIESKRELVERTRIKRVTPSKKAKTSHES